LIELNIVRKRYDLRILGCTGTRRTERSRQRHSVHCGRSCAGRRSCRLLLRLRQHQHDISHSQHTVCKNLIRQGCQINVLINELTRQGIAILNKDQMSLTMPRDALLTANGKI